ncbi:MAG: response regulator [Oligoflexales bacterium]|nr:response regulator [Oligoflexales bacterium]
MSDWKKMIKDETVLLVDDEFDILEIYEFYLENEGFKILRATNAMEAMKHIENNNVILVLTDHRMPDMDGTNLCDLIKGRFNHIYVVIISGYANSVTDTTDTCQYQPDLIFSKPVDQETLIRTVHGFAKRYFDHKKAV